MSAAFPTPRQLAIGVDLLTGLVIVSLAIALAGLTWRLAGGDDTPLPDVVPSPGARPATDLAPVLAFAPFGRASAGSAPATGLGITLRGILRAEPASASSAMIAIGTAPPRAFLIGQTVAGGTIEAIETERVLLRVSGRLESLAFPRSPAAMPAPAPAALPDQAATALRDAPLVTPATPASLVDALGASRTDQGYRIGGSPPPALARAGLIPGDVIERINDVAVGDADKDRQMLAAAAAGGPMRVTMLRGGKRLTLTLSLR